MSKSKIKTIKIAVIGNNGSGKSALVVQRVRGIFVEKYDPNIQDSYRKCVEVDSKQYMVELLDTSGNDIPPTEMRQLYMQHSDVFVLVYSITDRESFVACERLLQEVSQFASRPRPTVLIFGSKVDLEDFRQVTTEEGQSFATRNECLFLEGSSKVRINTDEVIYLLIREMQKNELPAHTKSTCNVM